MRLGQFLIFSSVLITLTLPAVAAGRTHRRPASSHKVTSKRPAKPKIIGQRGIDDDRASQIQAALIKTGYLSGTPSGHWDSQTEAAVQRMQAANGWQTRLVPDSRALIKLGLGPGSAPVGPLTGQSNPSVQATPNPLSVTSNKVSQ